MKILAVNAGSSSMKFQLFEMPEEKALVSSTFERIGLDNSFYSIKVDDKKTKKDAVLLNHEDACNLFLNELLENKIVSNLEEISSIGHRIVHGADKYNKSVLIDDTVIKDIEECIPLAPLHNPAGILGIRAMREALPNAKNVAVFDTAFHQTMPDYAYMYGLPYSLYEKYGIRRYGFHGTSHRYVAKRACEFLNVPYEEQRMITAHLGNGGSITAIKDGKSIDTSMGMTPVEGLIMGTRSGDVDPGAITYIMDKEHLSSQGVSRLLNKFSGVLGISGVSSDMREIEAAIEQGHERAILAMRMYNYRIKKYIGSYTAVLGGLDVLVFTGGVGENQMSTRNEVCKNMEYLGLEIDEELNASIRSKEALISTPNSKVKVVVIPTNEELTIALDTIEIIGWKKQKEDQ